MTPGRFIEAKLGSDLSPNTKHDPRRNQLARNVDVLLETVGAHRPVMGLAVIDRKPERLHARLVEQYRQEPEVLRALLPHHPGEGVNAVVGDLRTLVWEDLLELLPADAPAEVMEELRRRVVGR